MANSTFSERSRNPLVFLQSSRYTYVETHADYYRRDIGINIDMDMDRNKTNKQINNKLKDKYYNHYKPSYDVQLVSSSTLEYVQSYHL